MCGPDIGCTFPRCGIVPPFRIRRPVRSARGLTWPMKPRILSDGPGIPILPSISARLASALSASFRASRSRASTSPGAGWRAVTWPPGGSLSGAFRKGVPSAASRVAQAPRRPGTRPGPCTAPRPSAGCGRSDGGRRSRPRRNDGGRATRRQAFPATPWPLSTTVLPTSAGSSGVRRDTLSTRRRYPYPSPSHDPWPGLRPSPDRPVPVRQVLKPVETAPGTLLHDPRHRDGQRFHPRPADPAAPSGQHHPVQKPEQPLSGPFVAAGVLEADQDRRDVVPRSDGRPDPRDVGGVKPPPGVVDLAHGGLLKGRIGGFRGIWW